MEQPKNTEYPDCVFISGLPLCWRGCNGMYTRVGLSPDRIHPIYTLDYHEYLSIPIRPMQLIYLNGWKLRTNDFETYTIAKGPSRDLPFGDWGNCLVTPSESLTTFWRSNGSYVVLITVLFLGVYYYKFM